MPRPPRRAAAPARQDVTTTPTRQGTNAITAAIPPFMLETPPHAPFLTTPIPPSNNPGESIVPENNAARRNARAAHYTPTNHAGHDQVPDPSQFSSNTHTSAISDLGHTDEPSFVDSTQQGNDDAKSLQGLRDISTLATWTLSSAKPGCGLPQLRYPSPLQFWQSDGPQPHTLTLHFFKLVSIVKMRVYLDFMADESYTPTKMRFFAGMSEGGLVEFGSWEAQEITDPETGVTHSTVESIQGWLDIQLQGVGGRDTRHTAHGESGAISGDSMVDEADNVDDEASGDVLKAMVVQVQICENHQNGKDTHVRGFQVFARDDVGAKEMRKVVRKARHATHANDEQDEEEMFGLQPAQWMGDPEVR